MYFDIYQRVPYLYKTTSLSYIYLKVKYCHASYIFHSQFGPLGVTPRPAYYVQHGTQLALTLVFSPTNRELIVSYVDKSVSTLSIWSLLERTSLKILSNFHPD